jgi:hypothetical protein
LNILLLAVVVQVHQVLVVAGVLEGLGLQLVLQYLLVHL